MAFHIMFDEGKRQKRAKAAKQKEQKLNESYQKHLGGPPDKTVIPKRGSTMFESVQQGWSGDAAKKRKKGLYRYKDGK